MDTKQYAELSKRDIEITLLPRAVASEICTTYSRFFEGCEDDLTDLVQTTIENELAK